MIEKDSDSIHKDIHLGSLVVEGSLVPGDGTTLEGGFRISVYIYDRGDDYGSGHRLFYSAQSGDFSFDELYEGPHDLLAYLHPDHRLSSDRPQMDRHFAAYLQDVWPWTKGNRDPIKVRLGKAGSLRITVFPPDDGSDPAVFFCPEGRPRIRIGNLLVVKKYSGDRLRHYHYHTLVPGRYCVELYDARGVSRTRNLLVCEGQTTEHEIHFDE
jgi:hypothetical protein